MTQRYFDSVEFYDSEVTDNNNKNTDNTDNTNNHSNGSSNKNSNSSNNSNSDKKNLNVLDQQPSHDNDRTSNEFQLLMTWNDFYKAWKETSNDKNNLSKRSKFYNFLRSKFIRSVN